MNPGEGFTPALELLWEESRRQVEEQQSSLEALRNRCIAALSVSALVAGLFGSRLVGKVHSWRGWLVGLALVAFAVTVIRVIGIQFPKRDLEFYQDLEPYLSEIKNSIEVPPEDVTYNLAKDTQASWGRNEVHLKAAHKSFKGICFLLGIQVLAWGIALL